MERVKIVLDADVLIHFSKAGCLNMLPGIFPEYDYVVLSVVYGEIKTIQRQLDRQIETLKNITLVDFNPTGDMRREYVRLTTAKHFGKGESACMAFCNFTNNVIGSSNLKDIAEYCKQEGITYLTTLDFLYYAYTRGMMSETQCGDFIDSVRANGSKLPKINISEYTPRAII